MSTATRRTPTAPAATRTAPAHEHEWGLRGVEFEDGASIRTFDAAAASRCGSPDPGPRGQHHRTTSTTWSGRPAGPRT